MKEILELSISDIDDIYNFEKLCFPDEYTSMKIWTELLEDERTSVFSIKEKNEIVAFISIYNWKGENNYIKIMCIATHVSHRNKGYANTLMKFVIDQMLKDNMYIFKAETRVSNIKMQKVFSNFAYENVETVDNYYDSPAEAAYKYSLAITQSN